jgi:hypothetical protein
MFAITQAQFDEWLLWAMTFVAGYFIAVAFHYRSEFRQAAAREKVAWEAARLAEQLNIDLHLKLRAAAERIATQSELLSIRSERAI